MVSLHINVQAGHHKADLWGQDMEWLLGVNALRLRQNGHHFPDDILKWIFMNKKVWILYDISLEFVTLVTINNVLPWVQIMARSQPGTNQAINLTNDG